MSIPEYTSYWNNFELINICTYYIHNCRKNKPPLDKTPKQPVCTVGLFMNSTVKNFKTEYTSMEF